jgi:prepilin-type N-terminal cleavage/methylation domain-containing protein
MRSCDSERPRCDRTRKIEKRRGFTLVELLVVIGIITILVGLLLPVLAKVRDAALTTQCMSNLRQEGVAVNQYVNDSHGFLPPYLLAGNYTATNAPYIFQYLPQIYQTANAATWVCPADDLQLIMGPGPIPGPPANERGPYPEVYSGRLDIFYSYALNWDEPLSQSLLYPATSPYFNPGLAMKVKQSASFMFLLETHQDGLLEYNSQNNWFRFSHQRNTAMNVLCLDGHVDTLKASEMLPSVTSWTSQMRALWFGRPDTADQMLF